MKNEKTLTSFYDAGETAGSIDEGSKSVIIEKLKHKYALSTQGAKDMIKACISVAVTDIILTVQPDKRPSGRNAYCRAHTFLCCRFRDSFDPHRHIQFHPV